MCPLQIAVRSQLARRLRPEYAVRKRVDRRYGICVHRLNSRGRKRCMNMLFRDGLDRRRCF